MFNWFRRKFEDKASEQEAEAESKLTPAETEADTEEAAEPASESVNEDYLKWAKAAYKNIQQRQQEQEAQPEETVESEEEATETTAATTETEAVEEVTEPAAETIETELEATESVAETAETETIEEASEPTAETIETEAVEESGEPETAVPLWMRKSDGLERLKETAIDLEEPEEAKPAAGVAFDDDFIWSAKVLAAQGRNPEDVSEEEISWLKRLRQGLGKTRRSLINQLKSIVGQGPLNEDAVMEIEALLLQADVGVEATDYIIETLQNKLREEALPPEQAIAYLKTIIQDLLDKPLENVKNPGFAPDQDSLNIWLLTGVNGAGKTTTIGKLAYLAQTSGYECIIAAADTFRAAAVEQVTIWGERSNTPVIANPGKNTDPAAVVFDALTAAQSRQAKLLLVDTAGRLQNKKNLMDELAKIRRIIDKKAPQAQVESLLVLDATLGQNGLRQAEVFSEAAKLSGVVLTKLDGSAKGGVALAVAQQLNLPIRFIGAGEGIEDLRPFSSYEFVEALLSG